jgi:predicted TPR repeat methyltransferase
MAEARTSLEESIAAHQAGRLEEAEAGYLACLDERPDDPDALHFLGLLRMHQRRPQEGLELVRRSISLLPTNPHAWNNLGNMLVNAGRDDEALAAYERAASLAPGMIQAIHNVGVLLRRSRRLEDAVAVFTRIIATDPRFTPAYENLASLLYRMGRTEHVAAVYRQWHEVDPENPVARHMALATSGGAVPDRAATDYVATTFDEFADTFDQSLNKLEYVAPQLLAALLGEHVATGRGDLDVLDAGCGTGLCGLLLRSTAGRLVGVDISRGMLAKAKERAIYDELVPGELCDVMRSRPGSFDVIVSGDTLIYFGALDDPLAAARTALRPGGVFAFTLEEGPPDSPAGYALLAHGRYAHSRRYIESRLEDAGFSDVSIESAILRKEVDEDVNGFAVIARVPAR